MYVPGNDERKISKIPQLGADCICLDCEDGVALSMKVPTFMMMSWVCAGEWRNRRAPSQRLDETKKSNTIKQCCGSRSKLDPYSSTLWIRIRNTDPISYSEYGFGFTQVIVG